MIFNAKISNADFVLQWGFNPVVDKREFPMPNFELVDFYYKFWRNYCGWLIKS